MWLASAILFDSQFGKAIKVRVVTLLKLLLNHSFELKFHVMSSLFQIEFTDPPVVLSLPQQAAVLETPPNDTWQIRITALRIADKVSGIFFLPGT